MANTQPTVASQQADLTTGQLPTKGAAVDPRGRSKQDEDVQEVWINEVNVYEFMRHADNGTGGFLFGQYLTAHSRERSFKERRNYSYYLNFTKRILNALTKPIFREEPVRKIAGENPFYDLFMKNCNRRGHTFNDFMKRVARKTKRYGVYFVVVDNDKAEALAKSEGDAISKKQYPYVYCYSPEDLCEYEWDDLQRLSRVVFREWQKNVEGEKVWRYREWTPTGWTLFELEEDQKTGVKTRKVIETGAITIGEIPIIPVYDEEPDEEEDPVLPHPPLYHVARTNLAVYDVSSELRELERNQMFSLMRIPVEPGGKIGQLEVGTKNAIPFPMTASQPPDFMSPDPDIARAIMEDRKFLIEQMFEMASLVGIVGMVVKQESGRAKEWEFQSAREELTRFGHVMERAEMEVIRIFGLYLKKDLQYEVNYSENYGLVDMTAETEAASEALALNISPRVNQEIKKDWVAKNFRDSKDELVTELLNSIVLETADQVFSQAAAGDKGAGPAAPAKPPAAPTDGDGSSGAANGTQGGDGNGE